jgi:hypothetical protein
MVSTSITAAAPATTAILLKASRSFTTSTIPILRKRTSGCYQKKSQIITKTISHGLIKPFKKLVSRSNKIFWGGDCKLIEESAGSLEFGKDVVAQALAGRIERGLLTKKIAFDIVRKIFRENAITMFKLKDKLK